MAVRGYFRFPALDAHGHLAFTSDSDLFLAHLPPSLDEIAADAEMAAVRLTRGQGCAAFASFSADGERLAFASSHEGGAVDLYVMPTKGGRIARLTFEGNVDDELVGARNGTVVCGWQGDQVLYASPHFTTLPDAQLSLCSATTGDVERIPLAQASDGCFATLNNQRMLFFTRLPPQSSHTRRYHGGSAQTLWRVDLNVDGSPAAEAVALTPDTEFQGTSKRPQWSAALQRLFFLSDRGETETMNLWSMGADGSDKCQHTYARSSEYELRHVSLVDIAPDTSRAVYQQGADLFAIDLTDRTSQPAPVLLPIVLNTGFELQEEQLVGNPLQYLTAAALSPSGDKVSMSIRGQVFVLPTDADSNGRIVDATAKLPAAQRWKQLEFLSETTIVAIGNASGEDELYLLPTSGMTAEGGSDAGAGVVQLTSDGFCMRSSLCISPNGSHIALLDSERNLWVIDVAEAKASDEPGAGTVLVHHADNYGTTHAELSWSPDGCWLAFVTAAPNTFDTLQVWECGSNAAPIPITSDRSANHSPAWSPDGCWLYFLSDRELKNVVGSPWGDRVPEPQFDKSTRVYALALQEGLRPPWLLLNELTDQEDEEDEEDEDDAEEDTDGAEDDETDEDGNAAGDDGGAKKKRQSKKGGKTHAVVMAGGPAATATRLYELPIASGNYTSVVALPNDKLLLRTGGTLSRVVLEPKQSLKRRNVASGVSRMVLSADSSSLLLGFGASGFYVFTTSAVSFKPSSDTKVVTSGLRVTVDPVEERSAMYTDAWRMLRDQFYDPNMHGVDWEAMRGKYTPLLPRANDRRELNDILMQLTAEICALHHFVRGGEMTRPPEASTKPHIPAHLGAILDRCESEQGGGFQVKRIYNGDPERPSSLGPLSKPEVAVKEGDVLTHINGVTLIGGGAAPGPLLMGCAGQPVRVGVRDGGSGAERDVILSPMTTPALANLKYLDWELECQRKVEELGKGEIGYVHLRAMGGENYTEFAQGYFPVWDRAGLIIDVRHNRGGNIDSWVLEKLLRRVWFYWEKRGGRPYGSMQYAFRGHIVVLINEETASDGEAFAEGARRLGIATIMGTRTWGGEIWLSADMFALQAGGIASGGQSGVYSTDGKEWLIEGPGLVADDGFEVDNLPVSTYQGSDAQIVAAVAELQKQIEEEPVVTPTPPPYPNKAANASKL